MLAGRSLRSAYLRYDSFQNGVLSGTRTLTSLPAASGSFKGAQNSRFLTEFVQRHSPSENTIEYFSKIPWTRTILEADTHKIVPFYSRYLVENTGESRFFAETINTESGVSHVLGLCRNDLMPEAECATNQDLPEYICLIHLGQSLEAHPGIVNGGFQGVLFDEVMYCLLLLHAHKDNILDQRPKHYTLDLTTKFQYPVQVNTDVLVRANVVSRQDRKWYITGDIVSSDGKILTKGESHWLTARQPLS